MAKFPIFYQKFVGDRVALPTAVGLVLIIALAVVITMLFTGEMSQKEAELSKQKSELEKKVKVDHYRV